MAFTPIETERLRIRAFAPADVPAVHAYMSDPAVTYYLEDEPLDLDRTREFVTPSDGSDSSALALVRRRDGQLVGHLDFHPWFGPSTYELGWTVAPAFQRRGYAYEGAQALLRYGFETLQQHRVVATCQPENLGSYRVMQKLGLRQEAHFRQCVARRDGTWWDECFFALLADEWPVAG